MQTALIIIDMQVGVVAHAYRLPEVTQNILALLAQARKNGQVVVWVQHTDEDLPQGSEQWQLIPQLHPQVQPDDLHIHKEYGDSFAGTPLHERLQALGINEVWLCGAQSEACVTATLWGAVNGGYTVKLAKEAHTTVDTEFEGVKLPAAQIVALTNLRASRIRLPEARSELLPF